MSNDTNDAFEQRLGNLLKKTGTVDIPPLTCERLESLRTLIPEVGESMPFLSLVWKRIADGVSDTLSLVGASGLSLSTPPVSILRGDEKRDNVPFIETASLTIPNGELQAQILPVGKHRAKLLLTVKGTCAETDDLSVELSLGQRLIEARSLEQKVEFTLSGMGNFSVTLFSGDEAIGRMNLDIGETGSLNADT